MRVCYQRGLPRLVYSSKLLQNILSSPCKPACYHFTTPVLYHCLLQETGCLCIQEGGWLPPLVIWCVQARHIPWLTSEFILIISRVDLLSRFLPPNFTKSQALDKTNCPPTLKYNILQRACDLFKLGGGIGLENKDLNCIYILSIAFE